MIMRAAFLTMLLCAVTALLVAQEETPELAGAIRSVENGQADSVRRVLPDLLTKYQNTAGLLYLQGRLAADGLEAVKFYQSVVDNFPKSEWADDALYRIYQYYYALGLYKTAQQKMELLAKDYPRSPFATGKHEVVMPPREEPPVRIPAPDVAAGDTARTAPAVAAAQGGYALQVGAFSSSVNAGKQKSIFESAGYQVEVANRTRAGRSVYLVWVGHYGSAEEARQAGRAIKARFKIETIIVERN